MCRIAGRTVDVGSAGCAGGLGYTGGAVEEEGVIVAGGIRDEAGFTGTRYTGCTGGAGRAGDREGMRVPGSAEGTESIGGQGYP